MSIGRLGIIKVCAGFKLQEEDKDTNLGFT
jgi:hypothetical protein